MGFIPARAKALFAKLKDVDWSTFSALTPFPKWNSSTGKFIGVAAPSGNDPRLASGTALGQIARWDGSAWQPTNNLKIGASGNVLFSDNAGNVLLRFTPATASLQLYHSFLDGNVGANLTGDGVLALDSVAANAYTPASVYTSYAAGQYGSFGWKTGNAWTTQFVEASPGVSRVVGPDGSAGSMVASALYIDAGSITPANAGNLGTVIGKAPVRDEYKNLKGYVAVYAA